VQWPLVITYYLPNVPSRYSDDEDTSYKIRRSATKLLAAILSTRPDALSFLLKEVSPILISRFGDREQTVRLEVWATYEILLNQVRVYGGSSYKELEAPVGGKRKRDEGMDVEEIPYVQLTSQVPSLAKALLSQIKSPKTPSATLQAGFDLLKTLSSVVPGCLAIQTGQLTSILAGILSQSPTTTTSALHTIALSFLALFFSTHSPSSFNSSVPMLTPVLLKSLRERHPRVSSEAFRVLCSLLTALKPLKSGDWIDQVYTESVKRLSSSDTDAEVRNSAEQTIGTLWICAPEVMRSKDRKEWEAVCRTTGRTEGAVQVVTLVAQEVDIGDDWVNGCVQWILFLLLKSGRSGKGEIFTCLDVLLRRCRFMTICLHIF
jgi:cullin-associated NEDD8-dissociated protein 1